MRPVSARRGIAYTLIVALTALTAACGSNGNGASESASSPAASAGGASSSPPAATASGAGPSASASASTGAASETPKETVKSTLVLNWFAEPEHGGNFAAVAKGFYKDAGLDLTIQNGGPSVSSSQIVAAGKADFGMVNADDVLVARQEGIPIVAIATAFQKSPQALFYHKESGIKDFSDLNGHKVYVAATASFWQYMKSKYKLDKVQEMKYTGSLVNFVNDPNAVTQGYVTSETYTLQQQGVDFGTLLNADSGYNIYAGVYITTEKMIKEHPDRVKAFVEATVKGWDYYKDHSDEINPEIQKMDPDMTLDMMKFSAEKEMEFAFGGDAATNGTGTMSEARWTELQKQMLDAGVLKKADPIQEAFTLEFLPGAKS
ncbi:ABC transporter substrate-binding protein [Cohnella zeiphila]|uniref:ABC transporter substrate-binding protein n=1 Tax=Cohnella zeiphila TaxID=2761120 RepID=A0A7X0SLA6_9BACL|nr:ABC transporter substrate-binding protein [Cohnella zeiphila]MBB6732016.1 ABC transporter substrate-binding protein [Cohnella zeiphila]